MLRVSVFGIILFFACQSHKHVEGQCFVIVVKNCGDEQFSNECGGACDESNEWQECGFYVEGNDLLDFSSVEPSEEIFAKGDVVTLPFPRFCGIVKNCICIKTGDDEFECQRFGWGNTNYWVNEQQAGLTECDDRPPPDDLPLWP